MAINVRKLEDGIYPSWVLVHNGQSIRRELASVSDPPHLTDDVWITVADHGLSEILAAECLADLPRWLKRLRLAPHAGLPTHVRYVTVVRVGSIPTREIAFEIQIDPDEWKALWSIREYVLELEQCLRLPEMGAGSLVSDEDHREGFWDWFHVAFPIGNDTDPIAVEITRCNTLFLKLHHTAEARLAARIRKESLVTYFEFPPEVRTACEQYLLYFVEFLKDLGIEAEAELTHEAGKLLFAVRPETATQALEKVREALDVYLRLPTAVELHTGPTYVADFRVQQLIANVQHLRGQLALAAGLLELKSATIEQQKTTIEQQRRVASGEILASSVSSAAHSHSKDKEEVLGGTLAITRFEGKGFEVNLPEIYRKLRRLLSGES